MNSAPTPEQFASLWAFARGDTAPVEFEAWFLAQAGLEEPLGNELHCDLISSRHDKREEVWHLRGALAERLRQFSTCACAPLRNLDAIDMGGEPDADGHFRSDRVFASLEEVATYGPDKYWLYISRRGTCQTVWLIAQEERIFFDVFHVQRIGEAELANARAGHWLKRFLTYEDVLIVGNTLRSPCRFLDPMDFSLQQTAEDLLVERPTISVGDTRPYRQACSRAGSQGACLTGRQRAPDPPPKTFSYIG